MSRYIPNLIFDLGAHRGEDSDYYLKLGFNVICVECDPVHLVHLRQKFQREIDEDRLQLVDHAIADRSGPITFYRNLDASVWGTVDPEWAQRNVRLGTRLEEVLVDAITPTELFDRYGIPHYLKVDIEGADSAVLHALSAFTARPPYLSFESEAVSFEKLLNEFQLLDALGYDKFKVSPQHDVQEQRSELFDPVNSSEHLFLEGSSGAFGEFLKGAWLTQSDAIAYYKAIFVQYQLEYALQSGLLQGSYQAFLAKYDHQSVWFDTHARHSEMSKLD